MLVPRWIFNSPFAPLSTTTLVVRKSNNFGEMACCTRHPNNGQEVWFALKINLSSVVFSCHDTTQANYSCQQFRGWILLCNTWPRASQPSCCSNAQLKLPKKVLIVVTIGKKDLERICCCSEACKHKISYVAGPRHRHLYQTLCCYVSEAAMVSNGKFVCWNLETRGFPATIFGALTVWKKYQINNHKREKSKRRSSL